jgi:hypothetical protein
MTLAMISQLRKRGKRQFPQKKEIMSDLRSLRATGPGFAISSI